jgi:uncharacterized protein (TIGR02284 family)
MSYRNEHRLLNHLIELCRDEALTLHLVASCVRNEAARTVLEEMAVARAKFAADLLPHAQRMGGDGAGVQTRRGAWHRRWLAFKRRVTGGSDRSMLTAAEHAEGHTLAVYSRTLNDLLQPLARDVVERQQDELRADKERVHKLIVH